MRLNLRNRILIPVLALVSVGMIALTLLSFINSHRLLESNLTRQLEQTAESSVTLIESWVESRCRDMETWAHLPVFVAALEEGADSAARRAQANDETVWLTEKYGLFEVINLATVKGDTASSSDPKLREAGAYNVADRAYFQEALRGKTAVSPVIKSRGTGKPVFVVATPVRRGDTVVGVLYCGVNLDRFCQLFIDELKVLQSGYAYLLQPDGTVVAHPDKKQVLNTNLSQFDWGKRMLEMRAGTLEYVYQDVRKKVVFRTCPKVGWCVAVQVPVSELMAPVYRMGWMNLTLVGTMLLVVATAVFFVARSLAAPIQRTIHTLHESAAAFFASANQISSSSQAMAEGASEQAASLEETSSSLEEISSMAKATADGAQKAKELLEAARQAGDSGVADMREMSHAMNEIKAAGDSVSKIIKTIDEIAFQTNILALNAAVEAARAGEAGMGFAVVADEVRSLAQRSAQAARETAAKIEDSIHKSSRGVEINAKVNQSLQQIVEQVRQATDIAVQAVSAAQEQSRGLSQVNQAVSQMDKVTQGNAATAEQSAGAAEELTAQAETLQAAVASLVELAGTSATSAATPAPQLPAPDGSSRQSEVRATPAPAKSAHRNGRPALADARPGTLKHNGVNTVRH